MTLHILAACGALAVAGVVIGAQTPPPSQPPTTRPPAATEPRADRDSRAPVTLTGCVKPLDASMASRRGRETAEAATSTDRSGSDAKQYVLTNVEPAAGSSATKPSTTPAGSAASHAAMSDTYILKAGASSVNLSAHVNHKVEVTGTRSDDKSSGASTAAKPGTPGSPARGEGADDDDTPATLTVTALKMVSTTCP